MGGDEALGGLIQYHRQHTVQIFKHVAVPESQNRPAGFFEKGRAVCIIGLGITMLGAIKLQRQLCSAASHVHYIGTDDKLPGKARPVAR